jgi:transposase
MQFNYFIGIDVSKGTLDFTVLKGVDKLFYTQTENSSKGVKAFIKQLKSHAEAKLEECLFCMEHTGIYNNPLIEYFEKYKCQVALESAIHIKCLVELCEVRMIR